MEVGIFGNFDIFCHIFRAEYFKFKKILKLRLVCKWFNENITIQVYKRFYEEFYLDVIKYSEFLKGNLIHIYNSIYLTNEFKVFPSMRNKILTQELVFLKCIDFREFLKLINRVNISLAIFELHLDIYTPNETDDKIELGKNSVSIPGSKMIYKRRSKLTPYRYLRRNNSVLFADYYFKPRCEQCKNELIDRELEIGFTFQCGSIYICIDCAYRKYTRGDYRNFSISDIKTFETMREVKIEVNKTNFIKCKYSLCVDNYDYFRSHLHWKQTIYKNLKPWNNIVNGNSIIVNYEYDIHKNVSISEDKLRLDLHFYECRIPEIRAPLFSLESIQDNYPGKKEGLNILHPTFQIFPSSVGEVSINIPGYSDDETGEKEIHHNIFKNFVIRYVESQFNEKNLKLGLSLQIHYNNTKKFISEYPFYTIEDILKRERYTKVISKKRKYYIKESKIRKEQIKKIRE